MTSPSCPTRRPPRDRPDGTGRRLALILALAAALLTGCRGPEPPRQVIVIVVDALRADRLSGAGYARETTPELDALAARGLTFHRHFSQGTKTRTALPALLFSRYYAQPLFPNSDRVAFADLEDLFRTADSESLSLPKAFAGAGYHTAILSAHAWIKPETAFAMEFDEVHDLGSTLDYDRRYGFPPADQVVAAALAWLETNRERRFFLYLHLMDTHLPHFLDADARAFLTPDRLAHLPTGSFTATGKPRDIGRLPSPDERAYLDALYDGSLRFADRHLGRLFDALSPLDEVALAVTSDHGELLLEWPGRFGHGGKAYDLVARAPLILVSPGEVEPGRVDGLTEAVDLHPTLLALAGIELPQGKRADGRNLLPEREAGAGRGHVFLPGMARGERYKALFDQDDRILLDRESPSPAALSGELYDLQADPGETENLWERHPEKVEGLLAAYRRRMAPAYARYRAATTREQPSSAFAVSALHLSERPVRRLGLRRDPGALGHLDPAETGWVRLLKAGTNFLLAGSEAGPLPLAFPLPDGRYRLSAQLAGRARLRLEGEEEEHLLAGPAVDLREPPPWGLTRLELGTVEVTGETLRATLVPESRAVPFLLEFLGFEPLGNAGTGRMPPPVDPEHEERLKSLGYVR